MLQQRAAVAMYQTLRQPRRARRVHDEQWMIERHTCHRKTILRLVAPQITPCDRFVDSAQRRLRAHVRHHDQMLHRFQLDAQRTCTIERLDHFATVSIAVSDEQHLRLHLSESIEHAFVAEVG